VPRDLPTPEFRLRPRHALYLIDLVVAAVLFVIVGRAFMDQKGSKVIAAKEKARAEAQVAGQKALAQADSVLAAQRALLESMRADSIQWFADYQTRGAKLQAGYAQKQMLSQSLEALSNQVFGMRDRSSEAVQKAQEYEKDVSERKDEIGSLSSQAHTADSTLKATEAQRQDAASKLDGAVRTRTYEPVGLFPDRSGLSVRQEISDKTDLTNFELQHVVRQGSMVDLGVSLGVGLGSGDRTASKQVGLILSRELIHRRLGLDFGAGYSLLSDRSGNDESGAYASAGIRYSPFYKERLHFGAGARAVQGEVLPYIGVTVGRR
jgi:hypothetical protein